MTSKQNGFRAYDARVITPTASIRHPRQTRGFTSDSAYAILETRAVEHTPREERDKMNDRDLKALREELIAFELREARIYGEPMTRAAAARKVDANLKVAR